MKYFPLFLRIEGRRCVVIGGGPVAERKVSALLAAGAQVRVVSPELTEGLRGLAASGTIEYRARRYCSADLNGCVLVFAATGDDRVHLEIAADARSAELPLNVADRPALCDFIMPAVARRGELTVAVSTGGASPALARRVREEIEAMLGAEYGLAVALLGRLREHLRGRLSEEGRRRVFEALLGSDLLDCLRRGDRAAIDRLLDTHVGAGVTLDSLGVCLES